MGSSGQEKDEFSFTRTKNVLVTNDKRKNGKLEQTEVLADTEEQKENVYSDERKGFVTLLMTVQVNYLLQTNCHGKVPVNTVRKNKSLILISSSLWSY